LEVRSRADLLENNTKSYQQIMKSSLSLFSDLILNLHSHRISAVFIADPFLMIDNMRKAREYGGYSVDIYTDLLICAPIAPTIDEQICVSSFYTNPDLKIKLFFATLSLIHTKKRVYIFSFEAMAYFTKLFNINNNLTNTAFSVDFLIG